MKKINTLLIKVINQEEKKKQDIKIGKWKTTFKISGITHLLTDRCVMLQQFVIFHTKSSDAKAVNIPFMFNYRI